MGFCAEGEVFGLAFLDISTGEVKASQISGFDPFISEALRNEPKEILSFQGFQQHPCFDRFKKVFENGLLSLMEESQFASLHPVNEIGGESSLRIAPLAALATEMVLRYAAENQKRPLSHLRPLVYYRVQDFLVVDEVAQKNLELAQSLVDQGKKGSLFWVMDETMPARGSG